MSAITFRKETNDFVTCIMYLNQYDEDNRQPNLLQHERGDLLALSQGNIKTIFSLS